MDLCKLELLGSGEHLLVSREILSYFATLANMIADFEIEDEEVVIPIPVFITKPILQWCLDACLSHLTLNEFKRCEIGLPFLFSVCQALNWLEAKALLAHCVDTIYAYLRRMSSERLEAFCELKMIQKDEWGSFTAYYMREKLIQTYLGEKLIDALLKPVMPVAMYEAKTSISICHQLRIRPGDNCLFGTGNNLYGQLGLRSTSCVNVETRVFIDGTPISVACGWYHSLCLTTTGLYACGQNVDGELGIDNIDIVYSPEWIKLEPEGEVLLISAGYSFTAVLTTVGLFTCGLAFYGQLGLGNTVNARRLTRVDFDEPIIQVKCYSDHMYVLTSTGEYRCGRITTNSTSLGVTTLTKVLHVPK